MELLTKLTTYSTQNYMMLDSHAVRNLELYKSLRWGTSQNSLISAIDLTKTPMGGRLLKKMLGQPLLDLGELQKRQQAVEWFISSAMSRAAVTRLLGDMPDMERIINRVRGRQAGTRDLLALRSGLEKTADILASVRGDNPPGLVTTGLREYTEIVNLLKKAIADEPPANFDHGGVIRKGYSEELDKVRAMAADARQFLAGLEKDERERTGIKSLKLGYNRVFGYYIEVSQSNLASVPEDYIRRQTLAGGERYYTPQLKEYESLILNAQERVIELEKSIFAQVCQQVGISGESILEAAGAIANVDVFSSLAEAAVRYGYTKPVLNDSDSIIIRGGRHPVVEQALGKGVFISNETRLSAAEDQLIVLTGPNMAGKSTYLKQVALIVLLAQIGSYVPAEEAVIGIVDRIFTRLGAQEDLAAGQSTFMVEMIEVANILNHATSKSLLILDEVGRGTSTYDGLSIAWAVIEYIHNHTRLRSKTLFATHYHELVSLAASLPRVKNFNMAVMEEGGQVIFLRKVVPGGADRSYGIHVAQLAGLPKAVIHRAEEILVKLEEARTAGKAVGLGEDPERRALQLSIFGMGSEIEDELKAMDVDSMSPIEAINKLYELKKKAQNGRQ
jgi:DNA mismatch repair protein MutS